MVQSWSVAVSFWTDPLGGRGGCGGEDSLAYLEDEEAEVAEHGNGPHKDVTQHARHKVVRVPQHQRPVPVRRHKRPRQRTRRDGQVHEGRACAVEEVQVGEVEQVDDLDDLGPDEVGAHEEHDEGEVQEVVEDEVAADVGGGGDVGGVLGEEVADVADLEEEDDDPAVCKLAIP